jgi:glycosyltransferase involved in cell wall biosynthesis
LAGIYNLCDVFVCPSLIENLPNVCIESLFCGVPVTAFNTGGIPDIIEHKKTGYLAQCFDTEDLFSGICYCIDNHDELSRNALIKAQKDFNNKTVVQKHIDLYKSVLNTN